MTKTKRIFMVTATVVVVVAVVLLATISFMGRDQEISSQFGKKVTFPNNYEGKVWGAWLDTYPLGMYKEEYNNYDDLLAKVDVVQRIAAVVDPALTMMQNKVPHAAVNKSIYNGFMTIYVQPYRKGITGEEAIQAQIITSIMEDEPVYALNFDLHTGEQIDLRSVFTDNFDAQTAVDQAVQPYVLAYDEENIHRFRGVDLEKIQFVPDLKGIWLIFDDSSSFLSGKSIYLDWYRFGEGAVAVFDRFEPLDASEIVLRDDTLDYYDINMLYRSEPRYLVAQNTNFYLPTNYENDYERELAEKTKQIALTNLKMNQEEAPKERFLFERIGDYRCINVRSKGVWNEEKNKIEYQGSNLIGIFNIKEKREITLAEYYGDDYAQQFLVQFYEMLASWGDYRALVTDQEFLELAKTAKIDFVENMAIFMRNIYAVEYPDGVYEYDSVFIQSQKEWWG